RSLPGFRFVTQESSLTIKDIDSQMPMGDLGRHLRRSVADLAGKPGTYLRADSLKTNSLRKHIEVVAKGRKIIGLAWQSIQQKEQEIDGKKSLALEDLNPLLARPDCLFVNLQYGEVQESLDALKA